MNVLTNVVYFPASNSIEATWDKVVCDEAFGSQPRNERFRCHTYSEDQMLEFKSDVEILGGDINQYTELIKFVESQIHK